MYKKYLLFFTFQITANLLWAFWALPQMNEQGTFMQTFQWMCAQVFLPLLFSILLIQRQKFVLWLLVVYGGWLALFALGTCGWALMGTATPLSVYVVSILFLITGFGITYNSLKDLNIGQTRRSYGLED